MDTQIRLIDAPKHIIPFATAAVQAAIVFLLVLGLVIDGASVANGYLSARAAAISTAEQGAVLAAQAQEKPLSQSLLQYAEAEGAALVTYEIKHKPGKPDRLWVQARKITDLYFLSLVGIDHAVMIGSGSASIP